MKIHNWSEVIETMKGELDRWDYIGAMRGPDLPSEISEKCKILFTSLLRGDVKHRLSGYYDLSEFLGFFRRNPTYTVEDFMGFWAGVLHAESSDHWIGHIRAALLVLARYYRDLEDGEEIATLLHQLVSALTQGSYKIYLLLVELSRKFKKLKEDE